MQLRPIKAGVRHFDDTLVTVTDPGYNSEAWCTIRDLKIKPGDYTCIAWKGREYYTWQGKRHSTQRVLICAIYLDGNIPDCNDMDCIGGIGVDSGQAGFFQDKPDYNYDEWRDYCDKLHTHDYFISNEGFGTSSGWGDGYYPVFVHKDGNGEIDAMEIRFNEEVPDE